jgi:hypothetical protein
MSLYRTCYDGDSQPSINSLQNTLLLVLNQFKGVFIVLDSLDECTERSNLLNWVEQMTSWREGRLHLLVTSRKEEDISECLSQLDADHVDMDREVAVDIKTYLDSVLQGDKAFHRWDEYNKGHVKGSLMKAADGM